MGKVRRKDELEGKGGTRARGRERESEADCVVDLGSLCWLLDDQQSVCFQVPACAEEHGVTIVVSPLLGEFELDVSFLSLASFASLS